MVDISSSMYLAVLVCEVLVMIGAAAGWRFIERSTTGMFIGMGIGALIGVLTFQFWVAGFGV